MNEFHDLAAPYALNALEPLERARFEAHLDSCDLCRDEVAGFAATAARIGASEAQDLPVNLRARILDAARDTPQERAVSIKPVGALRRAVPRLAVAAALAIGLAGGAGYVIEHDRVTDQQVQNEAMSLVLGAPDAKTVDKAIGDAGVVRMVHSAKQDSAVVVARDLPALDKDKVYQLWMIAGEAKISQGTVTSSGAMLVEGTSKASAVAITVEPKGGSDQPTTTPVLTMGV